MIHSSTAYCTGSVLIKFTFSQSTPQGGRRFGRTLIVLLQEYMCVHACVHEPASACHKWPLKTCAAISVSVFSLISLSCWTSLDCPQALQLVAVLRAPSVGKPECSSPRTIPEISLNPPFKASSAPGRQWNWGLNLCRWLRGRWERGGRKTVVFQTADFPCWIERSRVDVALATTGVPAMRRNAYCKKTHKEPPVSGEFPEAFSTCKKKIWGRYLSLTADVFCLCARQQTIKQRRGRMGVGEEEKNSSPTRTRLHQRKGYYAAAVRY